MSLHQKIAIITGASSGIGEATALTLSAAGASVVLVARRMKRLQDLKQRIEENGGNVMIVQTDVSSFGQVKCMVDEVIKKYGRIDILVNNAGIMPLSFVKSLRVDEWERMIDVNLKGVMFCVAASLPHMRANSSGHIINISSTAGRRVFIGGAVYCATKFGLNAFSEGIRMELTASENIRISVVEPGVTATELPLAIADEDFKNSGPVRRGIVPLQASDIANAVLYAASQPPHVNVNEILVMPADQDF
ncbi:MAG: SDR family oxidoreductase [Bacteroidales bacterium]|nr:SDR family oxidoreductase [Bacteroidales bacterium]